MSRIITLCCLLIAVAACKKTSDRPDYSLQMPQEAFPLKVGNWWKYRVSPGTAYDTILLKVASAVQNHDTIIYQVLVSSKGVPVDTGRFISRRNRIEYLCGKPNCHGYCGGLFEKVDLAFPLKQGAKYRNRQYEDQFIDSTNVLAYSDSIVCLGKVYSGQKLYRSGIYYYYGVLSNQTVVVAPNVGIVYQIIDSKVEMAPWWAITYELLDYHVGN